MLIKENDEERRICNVDVWHEKGFDGENVHIVIFDKKGSPHEFMKPNVYAPFCPEVKVSHGTNVASVILEMAPKAKITMLYSSEECRQYFRKIAHTVDVVNISMSASKVLAEHSWGLLREYDHIPVFASAGNDGDTEINFPAAFNWSISVGALLENHRIASYSNEGKLDCVGYTNIKVLNSDKRIFNFNGTSASSPQVAGTIACYIQYLKENNIKYNREYIRNFIHNNTIDLYDQGYDYKTGYGLFRLPDIDKLQIPTIQSPTQPSTPPKTDTKPPETIRNTYPLPEGYPVAKVVYEGKTVNAIVVDEKTMVQLRDLSELTNIPIYFDNITKQVTFNKQNIHPLIINQRSYLHIREAAELANLNVAWDQKNFTAIVYKP